MTAFLSLPPFYASSSKIDFRDSIFAGLDYPGIGPEHAHLHDIGRAEYVPVTDEEAVEAFEFLSRTEGIIPAIESAHAVAHAMKIAPQILNKQSMGKVNSETIALKTAKCTLFIMKGCIVSKLLFFAILVQQKMTPQKSPIRRAFLLPERRNYLVQNHSQTLQADFVGISQ